MGQSEIFENLMSNHHIDQMLSVDITISVGCLIPIAMSYYTPWHQYYCIEYHIVEQNTYTHTYTYVYIYIPGPGQTIEILCVCVIILQNGCDQNSPSASRLWSPPRRTSPPPPPPGEPHRSAATRRAGGTCRRRLRGAPGQWHPHVLAWHLKEPNLKVATMRKT